MGSSLVITGTMPEYENREYLTRGRKSESFTRTIKLSEKLGEFKEPSSTSLVNGVLKIQWRPEDRIDKKINIKIE